MKSRRWGTALLILLWAAGSWAGQAKDKSRAAPAENPAEPLVRMDLLDPDKGDVPATLRDVFRPKTLPRPKAQAPPRPAPKVVAPPPQEAPAFGLTLTYMGTVASEGRMMALVTVGGQTLPVTLGEEISPGYRVVRITQESIEVEGANGLRKTFSRQGARP